MKFRNAIIKEESIKPSNGIDAPPRLEMRFILGNEVEAECYIRMGDINFEDKVISLMSFTDASELSDIVGKYVRVVFDDYEDIAYIGDILNDKYFKVERDQLIESKLEMFTEEDIKEMENK